MAAIVLAMTVVASCNKGTPPNLPTPTVAAVPSPVDVQTVTKAVAPEPVAAPAPVPKAAEKPLFARPLVKTVHKTDSYEAEMAAYAKAYSNAAQANKLLGEHRYVDVMPTPGLL
jgi:hypothetical protein